MSVPVTPGGGGAPDGVVREPGDHGPDGEGDQADPGPMMMVTRAQVCRGREQRNYESRGARAWADTDPHSLSLSPAAAHTGDHGPRVMSVPLRSPASQQ